MPKIREFQLAAPAKVASQKEGSVFYIGTGTVILRYAGFTILTDPNFLHRNQRAYLGYGVTTRRLSEPAMRISHLPAIDLVVLSHFHGDHFDEVTQRYLHRRIPIVCPPQAALKVRQFGFSRAFPLEKWESMTFHKGDVSLRVTATPGRHAPGLIAKLMPRVLGSILEFANPDRPLFHMYISGDTLIYNEIYEIPRRFPVIDLAMLHLGGTRFMGLPATMDAKQGMRMLEILGPKRAITIHHNDYTAFKSPLEAFQHLVDEAGIGDRVQQLTQNDTYTFKLSDFK